MSSLLSLTGEITSTDFENSSDWFLDRCLESLKVASENILFDVLNSTMDLSKF